MHSFPAKNILDLKTFSKYHNHLDVKKKAKKICQYSYITTEFTAL